MHAGKVPSLLLKNARQVLTLAGPSEPRRGRALQELGIIRGGGVLIQGGKIAAAGSSRTVEARARALKAEAIDCRGCVVMPGFVDSHTHLVFAGARLDDFERKIQGKSYEQIARAGGGIQLSARQVSETKLGALAAQADAFLNRMALHGTTTVEAKSGYGLDVANELKQLEALAMLRRRAALEIVPTLLAAHALPGKFSGRREKYLRTVEVELIPRVAKRKLAEFADCFCDREAFTVAECRSVLATARRFGLVPRIHTGQFARAGGIRLAIEVAAASADHLDHATTPDIRALARSNVTATLVPGANFHLGLDRFPPARRMIDAGVAVALATDFNPGTSPTLNMQFVLSLACAYLRMSPAEAIVASTANAAYSLRRSHRLGSLEPGKDADVIVMDVDDYRAIPYYAGWNHCAMTIKRGQIVCSRMKHHA